MIQVYSQEKRMEKMPVSQYYLSKDTYQGVHFEIKEEVREEFDVFVRLHGACTAPDDSYAAVSYTHLDGLRGRFMPTKTELAEMQGESGISHKRIPKEGKYSINRKLIESNGYKRKYNGITGDSNVDDALYKYAKTGLVHRDGTNYEDLYILSRKTGKVLGKNVSGTDSFGVRVNKSIVDAVKNNQGDLIGLHTHPDGTPPTGSDFETAFKRRYSFGTVACSDGSVYTCLLYTSSGSDGIVFA